MIGITVVEYCLILLCARACARACVFACMCARACACVCMCTGVCMRLSACLRINYTHRTSINTRAYGVRALRTRVHLTWI